MPDAQVSIIIPVLNEARSLPAILSACQDSGVGEIIVADGSSDDGSAEVAERLGALVVQSPRGRARQMNAGASVASGTILLFAHADTLLPAGFGDEIVRILSRPKVVAGAFRLRIDASAPTYRLIEKLVNWRSALLNLPYGDQALFLSSETFLKAGGFPPLPIMEDLEFVRRLARLGRIGLSSRSVLTSARRWEKTGVWKMTLINQAAIWSYLAGTDPDRIARWYLKRTRIE
jgi:rSAM/selenodomain-associated transferase 2